MDRLNAIWQWANREGHILRHKDLNAEQILELYGKDCIKMGNGWGWSIVDRPALRAEPKSSSNYLR